MSKLRLMMVDDNRTLLTALQRGLSRSFEVTAHHDVSEALDDLASGGRYDAVLSDVCMYPVGGPEFRERVRKVRPELADRFVFMSGGADDPSFEAFLSSTVFLPKPFSIEGAVAAIRKVAR